MKPQPNCEICKWKKVEEIKSIFDSFTGKIPNISKCGAQGDQYLNIVYNNKICNKLYEVKK